MFVVCRKCYRECTTCDMSAVRCMHEVVPKKYQFRHVLGKFASRGTEEVNLRHVGSMPQAVSMEYHLRHVVSMPEAIPNTYEIRYIGNMPSVVPNQYHSGHARCMPQVVLMMYALTHVVSMPQVVPINYHSRHVYLAWFRWSTTCGMSVACLEW